MPEPRPGRAFLQGEHALGPLGTGGEPTHGIGIHVHASEFADHDQMPRELSKQGGNVSPQLDWSGIPAGAAELVLLCEDPDAGPQPFVHWLVTGIDPISVGVEAGHTPPGAHVWRNDFGEMGYGGPQPPIGDSPHHYLFRLWALREPITLPKRPTAADVHEAAEVSAIAHAVTTGMFGR